MSHVNESWQWVMSMSHGLRMNFCRTSKTISTLRYTMNESCQWVMAMSHVIVSCQWVMAYVWISSGLQRPSAPEGTLWMSHVNELWQWVMSISYVNESCQWVISMSYFNESCQWVMSMSHVNESCQWVISMSHVHMFQSSLQLAYLRISTGHQRTSVP